VGVVIVIGTGMTALVLGCHRPARCSQRGAD